jgi:arginine exporter protein ArgO
MWPLPQPFACTPALAVDLHNPRVILSPSAIMGGFSHQPQVRHSFYTPAPFLEQAAIRERFSCER